MTVREEVELNGYLSCRASADKLVKLIKDGIIPLDIGGHFQTGNGFRDDDQKGYIVSRISTFVRLENQEDSQHLIDVMDKKTKVSKWVDLGHSCLFECDICGEEVKLQFNGKKLRCSNPCKYPKGFPHYSVEINIPSGKMVAANDLRQWWKIVGSYNVNKVINCKKTSDKYAEQGMAHMYVSNTCPGIYKKSEKFFLIGSAAEDKETLDGGERVGGICTNLWWFSIVDYDDYVKRIGETPKSEYGLDVIDCKPGVYRFLHKFPHHNHDYTNEEEIYTEIKWVRKPDPVKDLTGLYDNLNFTAGQIVADDMARYPDLFRTFERCADHIFCTLGGGGEHHPNGWIGSNPDLKMDAPEVEIPVFNKKHKWYPLSDHSLLLNCAGLGKDWNGKKVKALKLNDSFLALAFNICHCIVKYGDTKENVKYAKAALKGFGKLYPTKVPNYVKKLLKVKK